MERQSSSIAFRLFYLPETYQINRQRLKHSPELLQTYGTTINDQLEKGLIEKIPDSTPTSNSHYIPHHPVRKISSTTPIRIVYDCSCRQSQNQTSLNNCLQAGPPLLNDIMAILLRFRTYNYGIATHIRKSLSPFTSS